MAELKMSTLEQLGLGLGNFMLFALSKRMHVQNMQTELKKKLIQELCILILWHLFNFSFWHLLELEIRSIFDLHIEFMLMQRQLSSKYTPSEADSTGNSRVYRLAMILSGLLFISGLEKVHQKSFRERIATIKMGRECWRVTGTKVGIMQRLLSRAPQWLA